MAAALDFFEQFVLFATDVRAEERCEFQQESCAGLGPQAADERFEPAVYAVAMARLRNPTEAQELTQEVFIHGMEKLEQLRDAQCFAGWLRQITERMAINRLTRRGPVRGAEPEVLENVQALHLNSRFPPHQRPQDVALDGVSGGAGDRRPRPRGRELPASRACAGRSGIRVRGGADAPASPVVYRNS